MKNIIYVLAGCAFTLFTGCSEYPYSRVNNIDFVNCSQGCEIKTEQCRKTCRNNCSQCSAHSNQTAKIRYRRYQREVVIQGGTVARQLNSYRDPLKCRKTTCNCQADHQACMQSCGAGKVHKQLRAAPVC